MSTRCPGKCIRPSDHTACGGARRRFLLTRMGLACVNTVFQLIWTRSFSLLRFAGAGQYRRWMRRWFILKPAELTYHESSSNKGEIKGAINLSAWQLCMQNDQQSLIPSHMGQDPSFIIERCASIAQRQAGMLYALHIALRRRRKPTWGVRMRICIHFACYSDAHTQTSR